MPGSWTTISSVALRLDRRLRDAELVDAVADDLERLLDEAVAQLLLLARASSARLKSAASPPADSFSTRFGNCVLQRLLHVGPLVGRRETDLQRAALPLDREGADLRVAQLALDVAPDLLDRGCRSPASMSTW